MEKIKVKLYNYCCTLLEGLKLPDNDIEPFAAVKNCPWIVIGDKGDRQWLLRMYPNQYKKHLLNHLKS